MISIEKQASAGGKDISLYTLDNGKGLRAQIYNLGGIIRSLEVGGREVVLGRERVEDYFENDGYLGALVGRVANRIKGAQFVLGEKRCTLAANDGKNSLHGGAVGFDKKVWDAVCRDSEEPTLTLSLTSPDGDEGYPGSLRVVVTYTLTVQNALKIEYRAASDADTLFAPTNHSYFNLDAPGSGDIRRHTLQLWADFFTPNTDECLPSGEVRSVVGTPFDFLYGKELGTDISSPDAQIRTFGGYDHNFMINGRGFRRAARLTSSDKKLTMEVRTDTPGIQLYTANMLTPGTYKDGANCGVHGAVCLETQFVPNAINSHFTAPILKKGEEFCSTTEYRFIF